MVRFVNCTDINPLMSCISMQPFVALPIVKGKPLDLIQKNVWQLPPAVYALVLEANAQGVVVNMGQLYSLVNDAIADGYLFEDHESEELDCPEAEMVRTFIMFCEVEDKVVGYVYRSDIPNLKGVAISPEEMSF